MGQYWTNDDVAVLNNRNKVYTDSIHPKAPSSDWLVGISELKNRILAHTPKPYSNRNIIPRIQGFFEETKKVPEYGHYIAINIQDLDVINQGEIRDFISKLDSFYLSDKRDEGVEFVYKEFGSMILTKDFKRCEKIIDLLISKNYTTWILLPFLTLTKPYKKEIPNRAELFGLAVLEFSNTLTMSQLQSTIKRLI